MYMTRFATGFGLALSVVLGGIAAPVAAKTLVLNHFTLIDGLGHAPVRNAAMIVTDGRISWVGAASAVKVPAGAKVQDLAGKFVMPGLIDNHVHLAMVQGIAQDFRKSYNRANIESQLATFAAYGVTTVQALGTDDNLIFDIVKEQRSAPAKATRIFTAGRGLVFKGSYGGVAGLDAFVSTPAEARAMVDTEVRKGADVVKLWVDDEFGTVPVRMPPAVSSAVIDEAHKDGRKAVAHVFYIANARELVREGANGFSHEIRDAPVDTALVNAMKAGNTWQMAATLSREASFTYDLLPFVDDPFFSRGVEPSVITALKDPARRQRLRSGPLFSQFPKVFQTAMSNFSRQVKGGVRYGMGTDTGPTARFPGYFAHWELELMVKAGITPLQALTAATSANAEFMGAKDIGSITTGKWADLLVLDRDPTKDIRNTRSINEVLIAGEPMPTIWQTCAGRAVAACGKAR